MFCRAYDSLYIDIISVFSHWMCVYCGVSYCLFFTLRSLTMMDEVRDTVISLFVYTNTGKSLIIHAVCHMVLTVVFDMPGRGNISAPLSHSALNCILLLSLPSACCDPDTSVKRCWSIPVALVLFTCMQGLKTRVHTQKNWVDQVKKLTRFWLYLISLSNINFTTLNTELDLSIIHSDV